MPAKDRSHVIKLPEVQGAIRNLVEILGTHEVSWGSIVINFASRDGKQIVKVQIQDGAPLPGHPGYVSPSTDWWPLGSNKGGPVKL